MFELGSLVNKKICKPLYCVVVVGDTIITVIKCEGKNAVLLLLRRLLSLLTLYTLSYYYLCYKVPIMLVLVVFEIKSLSRVQCNTGSTAAKKTTA